MIDIYNEIGYIKNVLKSGLSNKWERDSKLLIRYFKAEGYNKSQVKNIINEKCIEADKKNIFKYDFNKSYGKLNNLINIAWKETNPLRKITEIEITKEVLEWFLNLENNFKISDEEAIRHKTNRPNVIIKNNKPINWERTKYLFTLYVWTKIQSNYLEKPNVFYLNDTNSVRRFKEDANLKQSFSMRNDRNLLYDLGFIDINFGLGITPKFIENFDVFSTPITDENRIIIKTGEPPFGDLYNPGKWLDKQKYGYFVCASCGEEVILYKKSATGRKRKYCDKCLKKTAKDVIKPLKGMRFCKDCGNQYKISSDKDFHSVRCPKCQEKANKELIRLRVQKHRKKEEVNNNNNNNDNNSEL